MQRKTNGEHAPLHHLQPTGCVARANQPNDVFAYAVSECAYGDISILTHFREACNGRVDESS
jgi:N-methylhydantoinase B/oxoprolinase/acetone carboxylase alpha subunit